MPKDFSCNLGSLNLSEYVSNPFTDTAYLKTNELEKDIYTYIKSLDKLIDLNKDNHPLEVHKTNSLNYRNVGLGVMGYSTALIKLGITYG